MAKVTTRDDCHTETLSAWPSLHLTVVQKGRPHRFFEAKDRLFRGLSYYFFFFLALLHPRSHTRPQAHTSTQTLFLDP
jgi:hypothetical protein